MPRAILGKKIGMTQLFDEGGSAVPVTLIEAGPCVVVQKKTEARDGYAAVQLGFDPAKRANKPMAGHFEAAKVIRYVETDRWWLHQYVLVCAEALVVVLSSSPFEQALIESGVVTLMAQPRSALSHGSSKHGNQYRASDGSVVE